MRKIIFLDIDGVLNVIGQGHDEFGQIFHKHFEDNLEYIIRETGAKIVLSSTWRFRGLEFIKRMWKARMLPGEVIDVTPDCAHLDDVTGLWQTKERGYEIQQWLDENPICKYVIIDDDKDMLDSQLPYFVLTHHNNDHPDCIDDGFGLTRQCADKVIQILNN